jgi:metallophosphoesterase (TIGR00282 family)
MNILFAGDIVGKPGRRAVETLYPLIKEQYGIDAFVANGENAAGGSGITSDIVWQLHSLGVDVITMGDHVWRQKDILRVIDEDHRLIRPANFPPGTPGSGSTVVDVRGKGRIGVINVVGRVLMFRLPLDCPFLAVERELNKVKTEADVVIVDFHAEATSETLAFGRFLDGRVSAVLGTHTHVQTADEAILDGGTAYITDCGMTGPFRSILGREIEPVVRHFVTRMPAPFRVAKEDVRLSGVILEIDDRTGKATRIERIQMKLDEQRDAEAEDRKP